MNIDCLEERKASQVPQLVKNNWPHSEHATEDNVRRCYIDRIKGANILTASNELASSLQTGEDGLEEVEAIQKELSMSTSSFPVDIIP